MTLSGGHSRIPGLTNALVLLVCYQMNARVPDFSNPIPRPVRRSVINNDNLEALIGLSKDGFYGLTDEVFRIIWGDENRYDGFHLKRCRGILSVPGTRR